jgi:hypothetical protein
MNLKGFHGQLSVICVSQIICETDQRQRSHYQLSGVY